MADSDYQAALARARQDLGNCLKEKQDLDAKILKLRQVVAALEPMCNENLPNLLFGSWSSLGSISAGDLMSNLGLSDYGLTAACRAIYRATPDRWMNANEIKEQLDGQAFDWSSYSQPMSALHTVLKRLVPQELDSREQDGRTEYKWTGRPFIRRKVNRPRVRYRPNLGAVVDSLPTGIPPLQPKEEKK